MAYDFKGKVIVVTGAGQGKLITHLGLRAHLIRANKTHFKMQYENRLCTRNVGLVYSMLMKMFYLVIQILR